MRLDQLQLDLHPRSHWQAIDLGMSLLRQSAGTVYAAWLCLWLPTVAICTGLAAWLGESWYWLFILPWWVRPLLERVVILVLSRAVFGERMRWTQAVREWPRQLGGGWFRLLTWWRPFMAGRGLFQPVWQLEGARGKFAGARRSVLARDGAGGAAYWFGIACANFELILQVGTLAMIGMFISPPDAVNPFILLVGNKLSDSGIRAFAAFALYGISMAIVAPIYTAGCFTLYLNRRAELEAWDIELVLKQLPQRAAMHTGTKVRPAASALVAVLFAAGLVLLPQAARAADCDPPARPWYNLRNVKRDPPASPEQARLRERLDKLYQTPELRGYECQKSWHAKPSKPKAPTKDRDWTPPDIPLWVGDVIKYVLIAIGVTIAVWLLYRYRDKIAAAMPSRQRAPIPDAIAGLDIRPESLPDDVVRTVRTLWAEGQYRAALALLYRATLSRLAHRHDVTLNAGATEGDCLRAAKRSQYEGRLDGDTFSVVESVTRLWLDLAYAHRQPAAEDLEAVCASWQRRLDGVAA
ncbi:MAG: DUF4129 domain-containing protein [Burkholderiales bacterium]|nr:DUF4129 domain-containing protein [Burkholderiales bacterium]